jgi:hypothetical protein
MGGFLALGVAAYFLWQANAAMETGDNFRAMVKILLGMAILFVMGGIFL